MPPEMQKPKNKKPAGLIIAALAVLVIFAALIIVSVMKKNPLKETLYPESEQTSLNNNNTTASVMNQGVYVDRVDVMLMESFPVQVRALVRGNLADGCTKIINSSSRKDGNTFFIDLETVRQGDMCTQALVPFEQSISLDAIGLKKGTYTVSVAGFTTSFTMQQDNGVDFDSVQK